MTVHLSQRHLACQRPQLFHDGWQDRKDALKVLAGREAPKGQPQ
jgi:hypothetical protein